MPSVRETPHSRCDPARGLRRARSIRLGIKGAGESGITGVGAAIASAIDDAIGVPGAMTQLPVTPQRLRRILNGQPKS